MTILDYGRVDEFENVKMGDADKVIVEFMLKLFRKAKECGKEINWEEFKFYCMDCDVNLPFELRVPESAIDRCMEIAREKFENGKEMQEMRQNYQE